MKDLYYRLGIDPRSSDEEISAALASKPELSDFSKILLDPARRAEYDETRQTVRTIGILRHHLGLDTGHSWFLENCPDFAPRKAQPAAHTRPAKVVAGAPPAAARSDSPPPAAVPKTGARSSRTLPLALGIIGLVALALVIAWFLR